MFYRILILQLLAMILRYVANVPSCPEPKPLSPDVVHLLDLVDDLVDRARR